MKFPLDDITACIIHEALKIHKTFGPGLLESAYELLLQRALIKQGLRVERQRLVSFSYDGIIFEKTFRVDLLVEDVVVVEVKSVEHAKPVHSKQLLTYLRLIKLPVGLLLNFGAATMKEGTERIVNRLDPARSPLLRVNRRAEPTG
ncbi:MAG: GxxExxY protein [Gemmatimonadaceae bacterium]